MLLLRHRSLSAFSAAAIVYILYLRQQEFNIPNSMRKNFLAITRLSPKTGIVRCCLMFTQQRHSLQKEAVP